MLRIVFFPPSTGGRPSIQGKSGGCLLWHNGGLSLGRFFPTKKTTKREQNLFFFYRFPPWLDGCFFLFVPVFLFQNEGIYTKRTGAWERYLVGKNGSVDKGGARCEEFWVKFSLGGLYSILFFSEQQQQTFERKNLKKISFSSNHLFFFQIVFRDFVDSNTP